MLKPTRAVNFALTEKNMKYVLSIGKCNIARDMKSFHIKFQLTQVHGQ